MDSKRLEGTSDGTAIKAVVETLRQLKKDDARTSAQERASRLSAADNSSVPFELPRDEMRRCVLQMRELAKEKNNGLVEEADTFWLEATLNARKGDVQRAYALASNYLNWRIRVNYDENTPASSKILKEIMDAGLFILAGNQGIDGRPVLTVRYRFFNPRKWTAVNTARAFGFIVEWMLRTYPKAQTHGIVVVEDAAGFSFQNFDLRLISFLEKAFSSILPVRMSALHIVNPSWIVKSLFSLFSAFFSDKLKARIRMFTKNEQDKFAGFFEKDQILTFLDMGGTMEWTESQQEELTHRLLADALRWPQASTYKKPE